ncbi:MAG: SpoIIIAH-like family protein [Firmicutes bacterium]|nr:SpoIIIAH-like family protein [Bacillota bacterium]
MFYVITRSTLRKVFLAMLLAILAVWFVWSNLVRDSIFKDRGYNIVNWRDSSSNMDVPEAALYADDHGEPVLQDPNELETVISQGIASYGIIETALEGLQDPIDEYLPTKPIYSSDFTLAIPTTSPLTVLVEPVSRREVFAQFRWDRDRSRSRQLEAMQEIISDANSSNEQRKSAQDRLVAIMSGSETEMELEGLLMAQGLPDAVVVLSETGATVMVDTVLTEEEAARIGDTVSDLTGMTVEKIRIIDQRS